MSGVDASDSPAAYERIGSLVYIAPVVLPATDWQRSWPQESETYTVGSFGCIASPVVQPLNPFNESSGLKL